MKILSKVSPMLIRAGIRWWEYSNPCFHFILRVFIQLISGFNFSLGVAEHAYRSVLISLLTETKGNFDLPVAAAIANAHEGVSAMLVIVIAHISDAYRGRLDMTLEPIHMLLIGACLCLALAQPVMLSLWWTSHVYYYNIHGMDWIQQSVLHVVLMVVVVAVLLSGKSGRVQPRQIHLEKEFLPDQLIVRKQKLSTNEKRAKVDRNLMWFFTLAFPASVAAFFNNASWTTFVVFALIGIPSIWCFAGFPPFSQPKKQVKTPLRGVLMVFKAAICKAFLNYPHDANQFFKNDSNQLLLSPYVPLFRWVDKAAIIESSILIPEEQEKKGKLCTVTQVQEVKRLLEMIPIWTSFLVYSLVESSGSTFFLEQSNNLDFHNYKFPVLSFLVLKSFWTCLISYLYPLLIPKQWSEEKKQNAMLVRISIGMACSVLCCLAAWLVEVKKQEAIFVKSDVRMKLETDILFDLGCQPFYFEHTETVVLSIFWLIPQYVLLGLMGGLAQEGLDDFFYNRIDKSMLSYVPRLNGCVLGIGKCLTAVCVFIFRSWFGCTVKDSRLDKYFMLLAGLSLGNLFFYRFVSTFYVHKEAPAPGGEEELNPILVDTMHSLL